jgi:hypothetical protein
LGVGGSNRVRAFEIQRTHAIEGNIVMKGKSLILLAVGLSLVASTPSWAKPRVVLQERQQCKAFVNAKGLKGAAWSAEYGKCMEVGPGQYK